MLFRKTTTRALPDGAKVFRRGDTWYAEWKPARGKKRRERARVDADGTARLLCESQTWYCRYRDASGRIREINTGCKDRGMAERVAADLEKTREKITSGIMTGTEAAAADWANVPLSTHIVDFRAFMEAKGLHTETIRGRVYYLETIARECRFHRFADVSRVAVERFLLNQVNEGMSARLHNAYLAAAVAFGNWSVRQGRITANPFAGVQKRNEKADRRRVRRALSETEAAALIDAARVRPLHEAQHGNRGDGPANLKLETADALDRRNAGDGVPRHAGNWAPVWRTAKHPDRRGIPGTRSAVYGTCGARRKGTARRTDSVTGGFSGGLGKIYRRTEKTPYSGFYAYARYSCGAAL